ncbi:hypothetical protein Cgig2_009250 [Carnegiea gigantea]|uniref:Zinc knuckle CX2CX4HX4C domain-containing protein n=1 Tax=Carnegiea gigantea TaxID=171969 RepID=A0A9Q1K0K8_9CARY|nr:hypothetical protein Cgig2_009250 [Carnegiea gigantea]
MAEGLEESWKQLSLMEEEEAMVVCDDPVLHYACGANNYFNAGTMKNVFKNVWKPAKGVIIRDLATNLFAIQFFSAADKAYVLNEGPSAFDDNILLLKEITGCEQPSEVQFTKARFWVKAMEVQPMKQTSSFAKILGDNLGEFVDCDETHLFYAADKSVNFQVDVDTTKPLWREMRVMVNGSPKWISFKYVKLPEFCYNCGRLGHVRRGYELLDDSSYISNLQYGEWLRDSLIKPSRCNIEAEKQEEKRLFMAFRNGKKTTKTQAKLAFGSTSHLTFENASTVLEPIPPHTETMIVDDSQLVTPGTEVFKRKLIDRGKRDRSIKEMNVVRRKLKNYEGIAVDARSHSGGVAMLWTKGLDVTLLSTSLNHVEITVKGAYMDGRRHNKERTCSMIHNLHMGGDLNENWYNHEKNGDPDKPQSILDSFRDAFDDCGLYDLGFQGYEFTWWNRRDGAQSVE